MGKSGGGGGKGLLFLLLIAACGAGGWNYHRNLQVEIEERGPRRFEGYSDSQLQALAGAYQQEIDQYLKRVEGSRSSRTVIRDGALIGDRVREFERVQASAERERGMRGQLAERQGRLTAIEEEQGLRQATGEELAVHLKRLLTI